MAEIALVQLRTHQAQTIHHHHPVSPGMKRPESRTEFPFGEPFETHLPETVKRLLLRVNLPALMPRPVLGEEDDQSLGRSRLSQGMSREQRR